MKVLFLTPYPTGQAPSQRFRFEQYIYLLSEKGYKITFLPLYKQSNWQSFNQKEGSLFNSIKLIGEIVRQVLMSFYSLSADYVFIHREILPIGPPFLEWIIGNIFKKKIIYDFDDAIWLTDKTDEGWLERKLRWRSKVGLISKWSYKVSTGNAYLAAYAKNFNSNVIINPTTIDTKKVHNPNLFKKTTRSLAEIPSITIGWTGSHSTLKYLEELEPVLKKIQKKHPSISFLVIADRSPKLDLTNLIFKPWSKESEVSDLMFADIGIMPLPNDSWSKGKCGFKALQYLSLEIPCLASPVGVNTSIIDHEVNGFLCKTENDWLYYLDLLIKDQSLRKNVGMKGRITVIDHYSVHSNASLFLSLFE